MISKTILNRSLNFGSCRFRKATIPLQKRGVSAKKFERRTAGEILASFSAGEAMKAALHGVVKNGLGIADPKQKIPVFLTKFPVPNSGNFPESGRYIGRNLETPALSGRQNRQNSLFSARKNVGCWFAADCNIRQSVWPAPQVPARSEKSQSMALWPE